MRKVLLLALFIFSLYSQNTNKGNITGVVRDINTLEPLPGANILVIGSSIGAATDIDGKFIIENVPIGSCNVQISMVGYKTLVENRVLVKSENVTRIEIELSEDISTTDIVVVKPTYFAETKDAVVSCIKMDFEEIEKQPCGSFDVQRAINIHPAVVLTSDTENELVVRGGNRNENLLLIDGFEVHNPNHYSIQGSGGGYISALNTNLISDVSLYAGAFPAKYGDRASSVMDISIREGLRDDLHTKLDISIAGMGGIIEGPLGKQKKGSFVMACHRSYLETANGAVGFTSVPEYFNAHSKIVYDITPKLKLNSFCMYAADDIVVDASEEDFTTVDADWLLSSNTKQYILGCTLKKIFKNGYSSISISKTSQYWNQEQGLEDTEELFIYNKSRESETDINGEILYSVSDNIEISAGIYDKNCNLDYDFVDDIDTLYCEYYDQIFYEDSFYVHGLILDENIIFNKCGGYLQYKQNITDKFETIAGARLDCNSHTKNTTFSPRLLSRFKLNDRFFLNAGYGKHYQTPSYVVLAVNGKNTNIESYYSDHFVLGFEKLFSDDMRITVESYYKSYCGYPVKLDSITANPLDEINYYVNGPGGYSRGIELFIQKKVKKNFWGTFSYSITDSRYKDPRCMLCINEECEYEDYKNAFDYGHIVTLVFGYQKQFMDDLWYQNISKKWWWRSLSWLPGMPSDDTGYSLGYRYQGGKYYSEPIYRHGTWYLIENAPLNNSRMPYYERLDLHFQSRLYFDQFNLYTYFEIENILNRRNLFSREYYGDGSTYDVYQLGRVVIGGIIIEF